jgi:protein-L-isoaspartate(D-aspartate) O-methyltransferase
VLGKVPRHAYVPASEQDNAYDNRPLAIGYGQTISQPYIVALMTTLARPRAGQKILEVGTGSGYQAAVLAEFGARVYTIEIVAPLATQAEQRLRSYRNVETRTGDGYYGWKEQAPFDAIVVTAACGVGSTAAGGAAQARRAHGDSGGQQLLHPDPAAGGEGRAGSRCARGRSCRCASYR